MDYKIKEKLANLLSDAECALFEARNLMSGYDDSKAIEIQELRKQVEGLMIDYDMKHYI